MFRLFSTATIATLILTAPTFASGKGLDQARIEAASGAKATVTPDGTVRIGWARDDVSVKVDDVALKPFAGLGSWAAFTAAGKSAMMMGDTVVFQDEVN